MTVFPQLIFGYHGCEREVAEKVSILQAKAMCLIRYEARFRKAIRFLTNRRY